MTDEEMAAVEAQAQATVEQNIKSKSAVEERMSNLATGKAEAEKRAQEAEAKVQSSQKEVEFYSSFSDSLGQYPQASAYKDTIREKVMAGYTVEDATISVLAKEGKLTQSDPVRQSPAGGSASNQIQQGGAKSIGDMTRDEKRQAILDAEKKGDISTS